MDKNKSKDLQNSSDANSSSKTDERKRKCETTHLKRRNSKLPCKDYSVFDLVKQSKINSFDLLNTKRKQKRKKDITQGKILKTIIPFLNVTTNSYLIFC